MPSSLPPSRLPYSSLSRKKGSERHQALQSPSSKKLPDTEQDILVHVYHTRERFPFRPCHATQNQTHTVSHVPACSVAPMHAQRVSCQGKRKGARKRDQRHRTSNILGSFSPPLPPSFPRPPSSTHTSLSLSQSLSLIHTNIEGD